MPLIISDFIIKKNKELIIHTLVGLLIGYFIIHPISMVIYWFQLNTNEYNQVGIFNVLLGNFKHSFSLHMMPMSFAFSILGAIIGLGSGFYYKSIKTRDYLLYGKRQLLQQSIPSLVANGESQFVEFKSSLRHDYRQIQTDKNLEDVILKSIAGFLNAKGGTLIIGVNDIGEILGLENDYWSLKRKDKDGFHQRLILIISNAYGKDICSKINITFHEINAKEICTLFIEPSHQPVFFNENNRTIFYLRTGNVTNPLTTSEVVKYLQNRNLGFKTLNIKTMKKTMILLFLALISWGASAQHDHSSSGNSGSSHPKMAPKMKEEPRVIPSIKLNHSHSVTFILDNYLFLKDALVDDNAKKAASSAKLLFEALGKFDLLNQAASKQKELKDILDEAKENAEHISVNGSKIDHQREHFEILGGDIKDLIVITGSDRTLYQLFCPMYNNNKGGKWLSTSDKIKNPFFGDKMMKCGRVLVEFTVK